MVDQDDRTLVTVIGGYLGAGKTTLVNHVLRTADERVAVLVNDFGDVNIDAELIESQDGDTISLANGCICCSLVDGLAAALETIGNLSPRPERLVIEASGVADPASIAAYGHGPGYALDAVVVVADAETVQTKSKDKYVGDTIRGQLRAGDILLLNKSDLVSDERLADLREWMTTAAPQAVVVNTVQAEVGHEVLFGRVPAGVGQSGGTTGNTTAEPMGGKGDRPGHDHHADGHDHDHDPEQLFTSWTWQSADPIGRDTVESLMEALPDDVIRVKGVLVVKDRQDKLMVLQRVGRRWSLQPGRPMPSDPTSRLVFIGLAGAIDDRWLTTQLQAS